MKTKDRPTPQDAVKQFSADLFTTCAMRMQDGLPPHKALAQFIGRCMCVEPVVCDTCQEAAAAMVNGLRPPDKPADALDPVDNPAFVIGYMAGHAKAFCVAAHPDSMARLMGLGAPWRATGV